MRWTSRKLDLRVWHKWFAWFPVIVGEVMISGERRDLKVWLTYVNRKLVKIQPKYSYLSDDELNNIISGNNWIYKEIRE